MHMFDATITLGCYNRGRLRCAGLVLGELGADQVKYWGNSFLELDTVRLPGVPFLDQLI